MQLEENIPSQVSSIDVELKLPKNQKLVYNAILNNPGLRIPALSEICGLKEKSIENAISKLKKQGFIISEGSKKYGGYYISLK